VNLRLNFASKERSEYRYITLLKACQEIACKHVICHVCYLNITYYLLAATHHQNTFFCLQPTPALYLTGSTLYCIKGLACTFNAQHELSEYETTVLCTLMNVLIRLLNVLLSVKFLF
jgi:hypothetical protein